MGFHIPNEKSGNQALVYRYVFESWLGFCPMYIHLMRNFT